MLKIIIVLLIISIISVTPQAFAQISLGVPADHELIKVTIEENGHVHVVHVVDKSKENVEVKLLLGKAENIIATDLAGKDIPHAYSRGDHTVVTFIPPEEDFVVEYDLKDALILKDSVWTWDFIYTDSDKGVEFYFPDQIDLVYANDRPVKIVEAEGMRCHGCDVFLEYIFDEPTIVKEVEWEEEKFLVSFLTLDEINSFTFDQPTRKLSFENTQEGRFITVNIPLELLWSPYEVYMDDKKILNHEYYQNETHGWVNIKPNTVGTIEIIGVSAIPEFSLLLPLVLGIVIVIGLQARSKISLH